MLKRAYRTFSVFLIVLFIATACSSGSSDPAVTQEKFGVRMAKMNLWREAMFRFKRAVEMNPADAMAHNNLAVAYEANGDFEAAAKEYREAIRLDKSNEFIQKNYSRFVEFNTRNRRRQQPARPAATVAGTPAATTTAETAPAPSSDSPAPATPVPVTATPSEPMAPAASGSSDSPQPAATAPAATTPPNPPVVQPQPPQPNPPGVNA